MLGFVHARFLSLRSVDPRWHALGQRRGSMGLIRL